MTPEELIIGEDNICPLTKKPCDDECCSPGSTCNLSGDDIKSGPPQPEIVPGYNEAYQLLGIKLFEENEKNGH